MEGDERRAGAVRVRLRGLRQLRKTWAAAGLVGTKYLGEVAAKDEVLAAIDAGAPK